MKIFKAYNNKNNNKVEMLVYKQTISMKNVNKIILKLPIVYIKMVIQNRNKKKI